MNGCEEKHHLVFLPFVYVIVFFFKTVYHDKLPHSNRYLNQIFTYTHFKVINVKFQTRK